jgi:hypothetical protein
MRTNRIRGTWCIHPDGPTSCYRTLGTLLGSSCWEPPWVIVLQSPGGAGRLRLGVGPGQAGRLRGLQKRSQGSLPSHPGPVLRKAGAGGGSKGGVGVRNMSGMSPDLPGAVTFAPGSRGGGKASRRHGPTTVMATTIRQGPATKTGACPEEGVRRWERR